jgi:hypothetical protein
MQVYIKTIFHDYVSGSSCTCCQQSEKELILFLYNDIQLLQS